MPRSKKPKNTEAPSKYWTVCRILGEKVEDKITLYHLDWEGTDPDTGKPWNPTWEPEEACTRALLDSWRDEQKQRQGQSSVKQNKTKRKRIDSPPLSPTLIASSPTVAHFQGQPRKRLRRGLRVGTTIDSDVSGRASPSPKVARTRRPRRAVDPEDETLDISTNAITSRDQTPAVSSTTAEAGVETTSTRGRVSDFAVVINTPGPVPAPRLAAVKQVIPDSQSFGHSTLTESQKQASGATVDSVPVILQQDDEQAPSSSFIPQTDPAEVDTQISAEELVLEELPATQPQANSSTVLAEVLEPHSAPGIEPSNIITITEASVPRSSHSQPLAQRQEVATASESSFSKTTSSDQFAKTSKSNNASSQALDPKPEQAEFSSAKDHDKQRQQAVDSGSEESQDTQARDDHRASRRESNELFHSDRPPSPSPPAQIEDTFEEASFVAETTVQGHLARPIASPAKQIAAELSTKKVVLSDSQDTLSQVTPQKLASATEAPPQTEPATVPSKQNQASAVTSRQSSPPIQAIPKSKQVEPSTMNSPTKTQKETIAAAVTEVYSQRSAAASAANSRATSPEVSRVAPVENVLPSLLQSRPSTTQAEPQNQHRREPSAAIANTIPPTTRPLAPESRTVRLPNGVPVRRLSDSPGSTVQRRKSQSVEPTPARVSPQQRRSQPLFPVLSQAIATQLSSIESVTSMDTPSSIAAPPTQLPDTFVSQMPPRPETPSSLHTSQTQTPVPSEHLLGGPLDMSGLSFKEKKALKKALAAKAWAEQNSPAPPQVSGSAAPASQLPLVQPMETAPTQSAADVIMADVGTHSTLAPAGTKAPTSAAPSNRATPDLELRNIQPEIAASRQASVADDGTKREVPAPRKLPQVQVDLYIPVALPSHIQSLYRAVFDKNGPNIDAFVGSEQVSATVQGQIQDTIFQANNACFHSDAVANGPLSQIDLDNAEQRDWDIQQSPKLAILDSFFKKARDQEKHVVIIAKLGRNMDILERFVRGAQVKYYRPDMHRSDSPPTALHITMMPVDGTHIIERADLVIGLDESFNPNAPQVRQVRKQLNYDLCPAAVLLVPNTIEHITRIPSLVGKWKTILTQASHLRHEAGSSKNTQPAQIGVNLALLLAGQQDVFADLPAMLDLPLSTANQASNNNVDLRTASKKRAFENIAPSVEQQPRKRTHLGEESQETASTNSVTRVTDSTAHRSTGTQALSQPPVSQLNTAQAAILQGRMSQAAAVATGPRSPRIAPSMVPKHVHDELVAALRAELSTTRTSLSQQDATFSALQTRFEAQNREVMTMQKTLLAAEAALITAVEKNTTLATTLKETRTERNELRTSLKSAQKSLAESTVPEIAELGALRIAAARVEPLERRITSLQHDFEFTRQQYQVASDAASTAQTEIAELREENEKLNTAASGNQLLLRQQFEAQNLKAAHEEIDMLKQQAAQNERLVKKLTNDNRILEEKEKTRGMGANTRASSMPPGAIAQAQMLAAAVGVSNVRAGSVGAGSHHGPAGRSMLGMGGAGAARVATPSALARSAAAVVGRTAGGVGTGSRVGSRTGSRQGSPLKTRSRASSPIKAGRTASPTKVGGRK